MNIFKKITGLAAIIAATALGCGTSASSTRTTKHEEKPVAREYVEKGDEFLNKAKTRIKTGDTAIYSDLKTAFNCYLQSNNKDKAEEVAGIMLENKPYDGLQLYLELDKDRLSKSHKTMIYEKAEEIVKQLKNKEKKGEVIKYQDYSDAFRVFLELKAEDEAYEIIDMIKSIDPNNAKHLLKQATIVFGK